MLYLVGIYIINAETIEALKTSAYFTANTNIFNEAKFEELEETDPRSAADEKAYQKQIAGKKFTEDVIEALMANVSDKVYMDYAEFEAAIKKALKGVDGMSASRLSGIAMEMSEIDKSAVVQKDKKGNVILDNTTKDTEIIKLNQDVKAYMKAEVLPHVPDAVWQYEFDENKPESTTNKEKLGAEFPFTRYFYEYHEPEKADDLLAQFMELETSLSEKIKKLQEGGAV